MFKTISTHSMFSKYTTYLNTPLMENLNLGKILQRVNNVSTVLTINALGSLTMPCRLVSKN